MLIIQHRVNELEIPVYSKYGEIDIHLNFYDELHVNHDVQGPGWKLENFFEKTEFEKFFVDIKQNLPVEDLQRIVEIFDERLIGIFDVPFPSAYYAMKAGCPIYFRRSEYEPMHSEFDKYWLDPLTRWDPNIYASLLPHKGEVIIACPSLHGRLTKECREVWNWIRRVDDSRIKGIVTKHVKECGEILNEVS